MKRLLLFSSFILTASGPAYGYCGMDPPTATPTKTPTYTRSPTRTPTVTPTHLAAGCGDAEVDAGEECDDGNTVGGDLCSSTCTMTLPNCQNATANNYAKTWGTDRIYNAMLARAQALGGATMPSRVWRCTAPENGAMVFVGVLSDTLTISSRADMVEPFSTVLYQTTAADQFQIHFATGSLRFTGSPPIIDVLDLDGNVIGSGGGGGSLSCGTLTQQYTACLAGGFTGAVDTLAQFEVCALEWFLAWGICSPVFTNSPIAGFACMVVAVGGFEMWVGHDFPSCKKLTETECAYPEGIPCEDGDTCPAGAEQHCTLVANFGLTPGFACMCPFTITWVTDPVVTQVSLDTNITPAEAGDLDIEWEGSAVFPVRAHYSQNYSGDVCGWCGVWSVCPPPQVRQFSTPAHPLQIVNSTPISCWNPYGQGDKFKWKVALSDAAGQWTDTVPWIHDCQPNTCVLP